MPKLMRPSVASRSAPRARQGRRAWWPILMLLPLAACGQKGPLTLPKAPAAATAASAPAR